MKTHVYVIEASPSGEVKIGITASPKGRIRSIQTGSPYKVSFAFVSDPLPRSAAIRAERQLHEQFDDCGLVGEWFRIEVAEAVAAARSVISRVMQ